MQGDPPENQHSTTMMLLVQFLSLLCDKIFEIQEILQDFFYTDFPGECI